MILTYRVFTIGLIVLLAIASSHAQEAQLRFSVVDDSGQTVENLKSTDIQITTKSGPIALTSLRFEEYKSLSVLIMIDASASQERMLPFEKQAAETFIDRILKQGRDMVAVVKFTGEVKLIHDLSDNFASVKSRTRGIQFEPPPGFGTGGRGVIMSVPAGASPRAQIAAGATSIFDSVSKAVLAFEQFDSKDGRKVILLISDGVNTYGEKKLKEAIQAAVDASVSVYSVGIGDSFYDGVDTKTLKKLSDQTGGISITPDEKKGNLDTLLLSLEPTLRKGYIATFTGNKAVTREIGIEVITPSLKKKLRIYSPRAIR
ncbi:MAG TPA: VWA domain-containing protein [Pyrinomonadaceae bacterium]|nr:VWA domain-containing protein [Pyrinomonadaceae bacterium]